MYTTTQNWRGENDLAYKLSEQILKCVELMQWSGRQGSVFNVFAAFCLLPWVWQVDAVGPFNGRRKADDRLLHSVPQLWVTHIACEHKSESMFPASRMGGSGHSLILRTGTFNTGTVERWPPAHSRWGWQLKQRCGGVCSMMKTRRTKSGRSTNCPW